MKFLKDLWDVIQFSSNFLSGLFILLTFVLVPFFFPMFGIFLIRRKKKVFRGISGGLLFTASIIILLIWLYPFANGSDQLDWVARLPFGEILMGYIRLLSSLAVSYLGMFLVLGKKTWMKFLGAVVMLVGLYGFFLLMAGRIYSGT